LSLSAAHSFRVSIVGLSRLQYGLVMSDLPPEAQGLPSDSFYGCTAAELATTLRRYGAAQTVAWDLMSFTEARDWLLRDMGPSVRHGPS